MIRVFIRGRRQSAGQREDVLAIRACSRLPMRIPATGMSDQQLRDEMLTLFLAGQDTTAHAPDLDLVPKLARHPNVGSEPAFRKRSAGS